jgi:hypothetical protein
MSANGYAHVHRVTELASVAVGDSVHVIRPVGLGAALRGIPGSINGAAANLLRSLTSSAAGASSASASPAGDADVNTDS